jgi:MFS family permease
MNAMPQRAAGVKARLNPFVFPADTNLRFALLPAAAGPPERTAATCSCAPADHVPGKSNWPRRRGYRVRSSRALLHRPLGRHAWVALLYIAFALGIAGIVIIAGVVVGGYLGNAIQLAAPLFITSFVALWGLPLLATVRPRPAVASLPSWAFLEVSPDTQKTMPRPESLRFALLAGFVGGLLGVGLLILMSIGTSLVIPQALQQQEQFLDMYWYVRLLFTTLFLALLALAVSTFSTLRRPPPAVQSNV